MQKGLEALKKLIGTKIKKIYLNDSYLKFETDKGNFTYTVDGDCCSVSYFYDFIGVKKLLENGKVIDVKEIELKPKDIVEENGLSKDKKKESESIVVYGYQIITEHPKWGKMTSVFSFRNYSNGYYGGSLEKYEEKEVYPEIKDDVIETVSYENT